MFKRIKGQGGFTIIELVCVLVVVAIMAAVILPKAADLTSSAKESKANELVSGFNGQEKMLWAHYRLNDADSWTTDGEIEGLIWTDMKEPGAGILVTGNVEPQPSATSLMQAGQMEFKYGETTVFTTRTQATIAGPAIWILDSFN